MKIKSVGERIRDGEVGDVVAHIRERAGHVKRGEWITVGMLDGDTLS